ncbi:GNAT family N-acetyltransferase [Dyella caseinilytica]|uniref:GNAT family N-acetyltransferase n=1 Tax=Dyella caseinilytica TaxID=1849581 RepID=A0ABX7GVT0_9GAMM|nr:GNAT family N-acetyltransferase [Dyella caseinilytica]QRN53847.1 GNAT family N-acetyltransferase [Dyella caseinilytica]GFZ89588.1 N-acetyltransferase [Dyella caseinilytica]
MEIRVDDLSSVATLSLLRLHLSGMHQNSPPGHVFALDLSGLKSPDVTVWSVWSGNDICGIGALKQFDATSGEIKSMRTHPNYLRTGVASLLLEHIIKEARARGFRRLSLETGSGPAFEPAIALYRRRGFVDGEAFSNYQKSDFNQFLHLMMDVGDPV